MVDGNTCIDCHKGIAHNKVHDKLSEEELEELGKPIADNIRPIAPQWQAFIDNGMKLVTDKDNNKSKAKATKAITETATEEAVEEAPAAAKPATKVAPAAMSGGSDMDWSGIEAAEITVFLPGQASLEWVLKGSDHGGKRAFTKGDRCFECHEDEEVDIGELIASGEKVEPAPIPGKRGSILVNVKAAHDASGKTVNMLRFHLPMAERWMLTTLSSWLSC
jgi:hypothetical protein